MGDLQRQILKRVVEAEDMEEQRSDVRVVRDSHVTKIEVGRGGISGSVIFQPAEWGDLVYSVQTGEPFQFTDETGKNVTARVVGDQVILDTGIHMGEVQVPVSEVLGVESPETEGCPEKKEGSELQIYSTEPSGAMGEEEPELGVEPSAEMGEEGPAEEVAKAFHETYERLAPEHGYDTRDASAKPWDEVPEENKNLMIATVKDLLDQGVITAAAPEEPPVEAPPEEYVEVTPEEGKMEQGEQGPEYQKPTEMDILDIEIDRLRDGVGAAAREGTLESLEEMLSGALERVQHSRKTGSMWGAEGSLEVTPEEEMPMEAVKEAEVVDVDPPTVMVRVLCQNPQEVSDVLQKFHNQGLWAERGEENEVLVRVEVDNPDDARTDVEQMLRGAQTPGE